VVSSIVAVLLNFQSLNYPSRGLVPIHHRHLNVHKNELVTPINAATWLLECLFKFLNSDSAVLRFFYLDHLVPTLNHHYYSLDIELSVIHNQNLGIAIAIFPWAIANLPFNLATQVWWSPVPPVFWTIRQNLDFNRRIRNGVLFNDSIDISQVALIAFILVLDHLGSISFPHAWIINISSLTLHIVWTMLIQLLVFNVFISYRAKHMGFIVVRLTNIDNLL